MIVARMSLPLRSAQSSLASTSAPAPSLTPGELPAVCEPSLPVRPGELGQRLERAAAARRLVDLDDRVALAAVDRDGDDLVRQAALVGGGDRALVRAQRPLVEVGAGHLELVADLGRLFEHLLAAERVAQPVLDHRVERLARRPCGSPDARRAAGTAPATSTPCRRRPRRSRSPARTAWSIIPTARTLDAQTLLIVSEVTSIGMPASICAWRDGIWPWPAWSTVPITTCCDLLGRDVGALERLADGYAAQMRGRKRRQAPAQLADRRARAAQDHGSRHEPSLLTSRRMRVSATTDAPPATNADTIVVGVFEDEGIAHDHGGVLQALVDSGEAKRGLRKLAVTHAEGRRYIVAGLGGRADFDPERARVAAAGVVGRAKELGHARRCAGRSRTTSPTRTSARSSRARCSPPTRSASSRAATTTTPGLEALVLSAHHDVSAAGGRRRRRSPRPSTPPATCRTARRTSSRRPRWPSAREALEGVTRRGARPRGHRGRGDGRVRGRRAGLRRGAAADHDPLRAGRRRRPAARASSARR